MHYKINVPGVVFHIIAPPLFINVYWQQFIKKKKKPTFATIQLCYFHLTLT